MASQNLVICERSIYFSACCSLKPWEWNWYVLTLYNNYIIIIINKWLCNIWRNAVRFTFEAETCIHLSLGEEGHERQRITQKFIWNPKGTSMGSEGIGPTSFCLQEDRDRRRVFHITALQEAQILIRRAIVDLAPTALTVELTISYLHW